MYQELRPEVHGLARNAEKSNNQVPNQVPRSPKISKPGRAAKVHDTKHDKNVAKHKGKKISQTFISAGLRFTGKETSLVVLACMSSSCSRNHGKRLLV